MEALVLTTRRDIRKWKRVVALITSGCMGVRTNGVDRSSEQAAMFKRMIDENQALVDRYDPEGLIADGDVEFGDVPPDLASTLWRGRPISYALDPHGRAHQFRLFQSDSAAATEAAMTPGRLAGWVGDEAWSIKPQTAPPARANNLQDRNREAAA
jgi:hypothetical protein